MNSKPKKGQRLFITQAYLDAPFITNKLTTDLSESVGVITQVAGDTARFDNSKLSCDDSILWEGNRFFEWRDYE